MRVLISGAGIAGPTLAYWLRRYGMEPTLVEKAPKLRTGGYVIDFWGLGFDVAGRMGLLPEIRRRGYLVREVRVVNRAGKRVAGFPASALARVAGNRYVSIARGDLAAAIYGAIEGRVETIFGDSVAGIEQHGRGVRVAFERGPAREFDLVIGADGLHSRVRELAFGPQSKYETYLGYMVAAFEVPGYRPREELAYVMYTQVGQQASRFAMHGDRTLFLFVFADAEPRGGAGRARDGLPGDPGGDWGDLRAQKALLQRRFAGSGWECPRILEALDGASELYFDRVSQIRMGDEPGSWTRGRVTLLGDAAFCVSLLAGQGSALAMIAAYILAGELHGACGDSAAALRRYQERFAPFVAKKQKGALRYAGVFAPKSKFSMFVRNQVMNLLRIPWVADAAAGDLSDELELPEYG